MQNAWVSYLSIALTELNMCLESHVSFEEEERVSNVLGSQLIYACNYWKRV